MEMVELWLVRHGETRLNAEGRLCGWTDAALTDRGQEQARWLRPFVKDERFDGVWSSDLVRARETARLVWGLATADRRLREIHFGDLEGLNYEGLSEELKTGLRDFRKFRAPGGESIQEFCARVYAFFDGLEPGRYLMFTHGGVCRAVTLLTGPDRFLPTGSQVAVDWTHKKLLFVRENELGTTSSLIRSSARGSSGAKTES